MGFTKSLFLPISLVLLFCGCSSNKATSGTPLLLQQTESSNLSSNGADASANLSSAAMNFSRSEKFLTSGSIVLSRAMPTEQTVPVSVAREETTLPEFAPLLGYIPPTEGLLPAENETWIQIDTATKELFIYKGQTQVKRIQAEGAVPLQPGTYPLQHKQKRPLWYASDEYFAKRQLPIPPPGDRSRYRRGALGQLVLYPTVNFPIHSGPIWSEDVGGLRVSRADLSAIYYVIPIGTSVIVK